MLIDIKHAIRHGFLFSLCLLSCYSFASSEDILEFETDQQRQRYLHLTEELRCLVCQNQNLADSNAGLANDLRDELYNMIRAGKTDEQILEFMVQRYGDFVFYKPPVKTSTVLLWFGPFIAVGIAAVFLIVYLLRRNEKASPKPLSDDEKIRLKDLLDQNTE